MLKVEFTGQFKKDYKLESKEAVIQKNLRR